MTSITYRGAGTLLFIILSLSTLQAVEIKDLVCHTSKNDTIYSAGDKITLCVHFLPAGLRMAYEVVVDKYAALQVKGAYTLFSDKDFDSQIVLQASHNYSSSQNVSFIRKTQAKNLSEYVVIPVFSAVVVLDEGKISKVVWDNGCYDCIDLCFEDRIDVNTTQKNCRVDACKLNDIATSLSCDPKIYVSFTGKDGKGNYMKSAGLRISRFRQYSIGQMYASAKNTFDGAVEKVKNTWNETISENIKKISGGGDNTNTNTNNNSTNPADNNTTTNTNTTTNNTTNSSGATL